MDESAPERHITEWDESDVHNWLSSLGYPQYESQIREHNISGDVLCLLDPEGLKGVGIATIGQRLAILKAVYLLKIAHGVPIDSDHYVPPSEVSERAENNLTVETLYTMVTDQAQRIHTLEEDNRTLNSTLQSLTDEFHSLRNSVSRNSQEESSTTLRRQPSFKWAQFVKPQSSPTKLDQAFDSPHPSPQQLEHDVPPLGRNGVNPGPSQLSPQTSTHPSTSSLEKHRPPPVSITDTSGGSSSPTPQTPKPHRQESSENLNKSFKVTLDDPTWKVLPAALKKYRINNDNWQNYAMFICYGSPGNRIDRCLAYDEKPLLLFQKLKDAKKNPVFMLKHIKDIRSPIAVAQQKHAARKASSVISADTTITSATQGHDKNSSASRTNRPPRLEVQDISAPTPLGSSASLGSSSSPQPGWPEPSVSSPAHDTIAKGDDVFSVGSASATRSSTASTSTVASTATNMSGATVTTSNDMVSLGSASATRSSTASTSTVATTATNMSGITVIASTHDHETKPKTPDPMESLPSASVSAKDVPVSANAISYAVAIYPYMAEQDDEFDVVVGDTFVILSRSRGWWIVQRDPTGSGIVEPDKQGWVPAGCLLETNVPVASAIAEATAAKGGSGSDGGASKTPILPLSIISTSFPGIALMEYTKKGDEELDLAKDDALRVFKRYNHWSYAVKEDGGDRGWVPVSRPGFSCFREVLMESLPQSWFIGKVGQPGAIPATPNSSNPSHLHSSSEDAIQPQVSPMSSAFPTNQTRLTVPLS
ncbi:hypothetical protein C0993_008602 [Termitomyces sp. T159_Od127]|nr:hypothetical protein C0993_008602 [Termitomyces sp. T159_Od127]